MAVAIAQVADEEQQTHRDTIQACFDAQVVREEKEALLEHLEALAFDGLPAQRPRARSAALATVQWAIDQGRLPRELRDYPWGVDYLAAGLAHRLEARQNTRHPFQEMDRRLRWEGMGGLPALRALPAHDQVPAAPRSMPPAVRPESLRPLDTTWKLDGRFLRLGEMTGAEIRRKAERAWRLADSNERTARLMEGLAEQVGERQQAEEVLDDDAAYSIAVAVLGEAGARAILGAGAPSAPVEAEAIDGDEEAVR